MRNKKSEELLDAFILLFMYVLILLPVAAIYVLFRYYFEIGFEISVAVTIVLSPVVFILLAKR
jgi:hypothetical protein